MGPLIRPGRVALVTGSSRGIGAAAAMALAQAGARVVVTARNEKQLVSVVASIRSSGGVALAAPADIRDPEAVAALRRQAEETFGPVELLVSNAAVVEPLGSVWSVDPHEFAASVATNLTGAQSVLHTFVPPMLTAGFGRIVAVSSSAASQAIASLGSYCAGKAGFEQLHAAAALDLAGSGVRINTLWPGGTDTAMQAALRTHLPALAQQARTAYEAGRLRPAEDVAPYIILLLADDLSKHGELIDLGELTDLAGARTDGPGTVRQG